MTPSLKNNPWRRSAMFYQNQSYLPRIAKLFPMFPLKSGRKAASSLLVSSAALSILVTSSVLPAAAQLPAPAHSEPGRNADQPAAATKPSTPYLPPAAPTPAPSASTPAPTPAPTPPARPAVKPDEKPKPRELEPLSIGGVPIRGLNDIQVIKKIRAAHQDKLRANVELWDGQSAHRLRRSALGVSIPYYKLLAQARALSDVGGDVPLRFEVDLGKAKSAMKSLAAKINQKPSTATINVDEAGKVVFTGGEGVSMAIEGSALRVKAALESEVPKSYVELVVARRPGASNLRQFKYLLAEYSTPFDAKIRGRTTNLKMSAKLVNGEVVPPGKVFSTNYAIGPRNAANGWKEAKMFVSGEVVDGVGAGICQTATTIYNAALLANLPIVERHQHSFRVNYAPASRDATIYWGQKDMKFRNNTKGPIYVQTLVRGSRFYVRLYGVEPVKANVAIESKVLSQNKGTRSEAYRIVETPNGSKRELLSRDYYKPPKS